MKPLLRGFRLLVERQRLKRDNKAKAHLDLWLRGKAPSTDLRKWFAHDPAKWEDISVRYERELRESTDLVREGSGTEELGDYGYPDVCRTW